MVKEKHKRSITKALTWRVTGTLDTFILSYLITRQLKFAVAISATELVTKIILYYFHERVWDKVKWGRSDSPSDKSEQLS
jgi:uncharacterized membrane protein